MRSALATAGMLAASLAIAGVIGETFLRHWLPAPDGFYVFQPGLEREFEPREDLMPGVGGVSRFVVNSDGLRGDELEPEHGLRILAVGGSTTQCLYLDQSEAWPFRLQQLLEERTPGELAWVGNAGKAGRRLPEYLVQLEHLLERLPDLDTVLILVGANDVNRRLNEDLAFDPVDPTNAAVRRSLLPRAFDVYPREFALWPPDQTALWTLVDGARRAIEIRRHWEMIQDRRGANYQLWRDRRAEASEIREELPDLTVALDSYKADLETTLRLARQHDVRVIFMTQPYIYRSDLPPELERLLWMGWIGERQSDRSQSYYSPAAMARAYAAYNETLLRFCREARAECVDLEPAIPKDSTSFYDDIHFNESGSERVAQILADYLERYPAGPSEAPGRTDTPSSAPPGLSQPATEGRDEQEGLEVGGVPPGAA